MICEKIRHAVTLGVVHEKNTHPMTLVDPYVVCEKNTHAMTPCVVCEKNRHAMTLSVVHEKNTHPMTLGVVHENNTHPMTLVDPYVVCEKCWKYALEKNSSKDYYHISYSL